ncbi:MAG: 23S rRNA (adenine(2503)-C(2))-methyltransferase RlmN [Melioribacteraceae bacterium]|nr:23S rRNA (adenine(2503)-C(2))-methyltransferase RlmN [Melioribacteraceae bacterium]
MSSGRKKIELKSLTLAQLEKHFVAAGEKKFRASQVLNWVYNNLVTSFEEMSNIPKPLRIMLSRDYTLKTLSLKSVQTSSTTETKKYLYSTKDNHVIETVLIPDEKRNTLCISTQVGCPLDCKFCATGLMGFKRNLTVGEIVDQYFLSAKEVGKDKITNIVYMGMGEPLTNFDNTISSLEIFTDQHNNRVSRNRITISTSGIADKIIELADSPLRVKLALSLHSPFDEIRTRLMPINKRYPLAETMEAIKYYSRITATRITFEYTMLKGINDRDEDIRALTKLCRSLPSKLNVIPFNSIAHMSLKGISKELEPTSLYDINLFVQKLRDNNITVMVRDTQGDDIAAACGQLATHNLSKTD